MVSAGLLSPFRTGMRALRGLKGWGWVLHQNQGSIEHHLAQVTSGNTDVWARSWGREEEKGIFLVELELKKKKASIFK